MKLIHIALAVATAFAVGAAQSAVPQPATTVWSAGSSAAIKAQFYAFYSDCHFATGYQVDVYMYSNKPAVTANSLPGDTDTGNFFAYQCTFDQTKMVGWIPDYADRLVTLFHTVDGGSFNAFAPYLPVGNPNRVTNLKRITTAAVTNPTTGCATNFPVSGANLGVAVHKGCAITPSAPTDAPTLPDGGFSEVEADFWPELTLGTNFPITAAYVAQLFGVAVTDELYKAMQARQLADGLLPGCTAALPNFTPGACQPSISSDQYRSIISIGGNGGPWQTDWQPLVGAAGMNHVVNVCRLVPTSATQAASNAFFLENPCRREPTLGGQLSPQASTATNANYIVTEGASTGDVKNCLNNSDNNATLNNRFAIGVMSMENIPFPGRTFPPLPADKFKFVKINGVSGNIDAKQRAAGAKGLYPFVMEFVGIVHVPAKQEFFRELALKWNSVEAGMYILPTSAYVGGTGGTPDGDWVGYGTKFGNNCRPQELFFF